MHMKQTGTPWGWEIYCTWSMLASNEYGVPQYDLIVLRNIAECRRYFLPKMATKRLSLW